MVGFVVWGLGVGLECRGGGGCEGEKGLVDEIG